MAAAPVLSAEMGGDETDDTAGPVARSRPESPKGGSQCPAHANGLRISITCCSCAAAMMVSQAPVGTECPRTRKSPGSSTAEVAEVQPLQLEPKAKPKAKTRPQPKASAHGPQRVSVGHPLYPSETFMRQHWLEGPWRADRDEQQKMNKIVRECSHSLLDRNGTNGHKRRFKCCACETIWSGPYFEDDHQGPDALDVSDWVKP